MLARSLASKVGGCVVVYPGASTPGLSLPSGTPSSSASSPSPDRQLTTYILPTPPYAACGVGILECAGSGVLKSRSANSYGLV